MNTTNSTGTNATTTITAGSLREVLERLQALDPVRMYMKREGFDPEAGCKIVFPESQRNTLYPLGDAPEYVLFSKLLTDQALLLRDQFGLPHRRFPAP